MLWAYRVSVRCLGEPQTATTLNLKPEKSTSAASFLGRPVGTCFRENPLEGFRPSVEGWVLDFV